MAFNQNPFITITGFILKDFKQPNIKIFNELRFFPKREDKGTKCFFFVKFSPNNFFNFFDGKHKYEDFYKRL